MTLQSVILVIRPSIPRSNFVVLYDEMDRGAFEDLVQEIAAKTCLGCENFPLDTETIHGHRWDGCSQVINDVLVF